MPRAPPHGPPPHVPPSRCQASAGRVYALGGQSETEDAYAIEGMLSIIGNSSFMLFYIGATHSFMSAAMF